MRISKVLARQISIKLTEKSRVAAEQLNKEYQLLVTEIYEDQTPQAVKDTFKKHPDWFYTRGVVSFNGHGFNWENVSTVRQIICNGGTNANLVLNMKISEQIMKAKRKYDKAQAEYKALQRESEQAILNLKTTKNVEEHLPLAKPMLPPPISNALVVNYDSLKKRLERQPTTTNIILNK